ncbi:PrgI family protein [Candidatus Saccharibacteria bacterium]|nr:PrgI family protein [Candidatus Saccharibacteria bacterium]
MGTYKVIQDIEADDKLLGPLTLRQFIYAIIVIISLFVMFKLLLVHPLLVIPFLPHTILFALLAAPIGKDQSPEIWLLAKIRFFLKPKKRIWNQSGIKELVTITAPKKIEKILTDNLSQTEVRSRLEALASTIDSRGWAVKNVNVNLFAQPAYALGQVDSDRLIDPSTMAQDVPDNDIQAMDDILDERNNPKAQAIDQMITASTQDRKQQAIQNMTNPSPTNQQTIPADYWFLNQTPAPTQQQPGFTSFSSSQLVQPGQQTTASPQQASNIDEKALLDKIHTEQAKPDLAKNHLKTLIPLGQQPKKKAPEQNTVHPSATPEILNLAVNDDLNIATIARQAKKTQKPPDDGEVIISLR